MQRKTQKTLLPFAVYTKSGNKPLNKNVERAAVFCLTELGKERGGFFKKESFEKTVFISEVYYPFWLAPLAGLIILFDGLNISSHTIACQDIPDPKVFKDNLNQRSSNRQIYATFLQNHLNYFQDSKGEHEEVVEGLISNVNFLREFMYYLKEATATKKPVTEGVLVSPLHDEKQIMNKIQELECLRSQVAQKPEELNELIKLLNMKTQQFQDFLCKEIKALDKKFSRQIKAAKAKFEREKSKINKKYTNNVTAASTKYEQKKATLNKEFVKLEKTRIQMESEVGHVETEIKNSIISKDDESEYIWRKKRDELKKKIPLIAPAIKKLEKRVQIIEEKKKKKLFQLKQENDAKIEEAERQLLEIECCQDAENKICRDEMEKIEEFTSKICSDINKLSKIMEAALKDFDSLGIEQVTRHPLLVYMPFYLLCYLSDSKERFNYVAPSIVSDMDIGARLKAIGKKRITQLYQPRSQKIISILNSFIGLLQDNAAFSHEVNEACKKANLLESREAIELIKDGLSELKTGGWLSDGEYESFRKRLSSNYLT